MAKDYKGRHLVSPDVPSGVHDFSDGYLSLGDTNEPANIVDIAIVFQYWAPQSDIDFISVEQVIECVGRTQEYGDLRCFLTRWETGVGIQ